jgi:hypothetical protein
MAITSFTFDEQYYLQQNPDVAAAVSKGAFASGQAHFNAFGRFENRDPNAYFDTSFYLGQYPDVAASGLNPFQHFIQFGSKEFRAFNANELAAIDTDNNGQLNEFNVQAYLDANPDVKAAVNSGALPSAYQHFVIFGQFEGRTATLNNGTVISGPIALAGNGTGGANPGTTFTLTTGTDAPAGTSGNDTFLGTVDVTTPANSTLTAADRVNGGAGSADALTVTTQGAAAATVTNGALVSGIEVVNVRAVGTGGASLDANNVAGLVSFNNTLSTDAVTVTNLADPAAVTIVGNGSVTNGATSATYVAGATSGDLVLSGGVTAGAVAVDGAGLTSLAIVSNGAANTTGAISSTGAANVTINAATSLTTGGLTVATLPAGGQTLTVSGAAGNTAATATAAAAAAVVLGTLDGDFATVNASGLTAGGISATLGSLTATVTGGAGNDTITTAGVLTTGSVNAGGGTADRLVLTNTLDLATAALGAKYTGFEQLQVQDGVTADFDNISGITGVFLNDGGAATTLNNLSAAQAGAITVIAADGAATINVKGAATVGQVDTVSLTFNDGNTTLNQDINASASTFTLTGVENLQVVAVDQAEIVQSALASASLSSVTLSGAGNISFATGNIATANFNLNASASTGTNTLNANGFATNGVSITGGTGVDTITGSGQNDVINGGAGNDIITGGAGADALTGGAGNDTFALLSTATTRGATFAVTDTTTANIDRITDFVGNGAAAGDTIRLDAVTGADFTNVATATVTAVTVATAADFTALAAAVQTASAGVASTTTVAQVYDVTVTAGNLAGRYMIVNDATAGVADTDLIVSTTGITGALHASDFAFV